MQKRRERSSAQWLLPCLLAIAAVPLPAQQTIGRTSATEVKVSGAVDIAHGETLLGNGSDVTAGNQAVMIALQRGGSLQLCSTSSVYLARDGSTDNVASTALMMALEHGAIEANYTVGRYSDVLMTPDLRILISGPGQASLSVRVNSAGDTCVDNRGSDAPYVTISSQLEGGAYRVMPNQRVSFQHGSLLEVVDHEPEPCGCPVASAMSVAQGKSPGSSRAGPSSTAAGTEFPLAQSEGLAPAPHPPATPVVPPGEAHAQVSAPLVYNGEAPAEAPSGSAPAPAAVPAAPASAAPVSTKAPGVAASSPPPPAPAPPAVTTAPQVAASTPPPPPAETKEPLVSRPPGGGNIFRGIGHFFSRIFGR